ncbi:TonB-dependent receptor domain-containing protein [Haoranjiania flava]|uniref:TonB-dependent receptor n=1 Tax=Haoranjiania flava TaxID=1856322 RepID=A0AAE3LJ95_9BACT|nr:TonB-dependent receptor [Haoranjiania flava]MCU7693477.1 TonB-dependent receptor [Haoranjiania flava]
MNFIYRTTLLVLILFASVYAGDAQTLTASSFQVSGACGMCKARIEKAAKISGVQSAVWDMETQQLQLSYDAGKTSVQQIHQAVADAGHDTELKKAADEVYNALPACCHYRNADNPHKQIAASNGLSEQALIYGIVVAEDNKGNFTPLTNAGVQWLGTTQGTLTDSHGVFSIPANDQTKKLIVSFSGMQSDTLDVTDMNHMQIVLASNGELKQVTVSSSRRLSSYISTHDAFRQQLMTPKELLKAACCNLSESFETNPSIDVSSSDAVTGAKQIQMLGLSGIYTQLTNENLPGPRGLATATGLGLIPGPWIEGIQIIKGTGSVVNGFESIAGQINVELIKPNYKEKLYLNGYINSIGKTDLNLNLTQRVNDQWSTALLLHDDFLLNKTDYNKDGFKDLPTGNQFNVVNRWMYDNSKGWTGQLGVKYLQERKKGGELDFTDTDQLSTNRYGIGLNTDRYEGFAKLGYIFPNKRYQSIGLQLSAFRHSQDAFFGTTPYKGNQDNVYANLIYQSIIGNTNHKFRTGAGIVSDRYKETFKTSDFGRTETVPGAFFEYTYTMNAKFDVVAGIRADHNSLYGWFTTPRLNLRYAPLPGTTFRLSAGRGQRTANVLAENMSLMASARNFILSGNSGGKAFGLDPEVAWNKGISLDQQLKLFSRNAMLSLDFFRNDFSNQVVVDLENPREVHFYNLEGKSYSNSFQAELTMAPAKNFDVRLAYRYFDVKATQQGALLEKAFTAKNRAFANLAYHVNGWAFDYTINYIGRKRIPSTLANPQQYRMEAYSPDYFMMHAQVSKTFGKNNSFELYLGAENLGNFIQDKSIIAPNEPFGQYFDASMIWGPVNERMFYGGFRYKIFNK